MGNTLEGQCVSALTAGDSLDDCFDNNFEVSMFPLKIGQGQFSKTFRCWRRGHRDDAYAMKVYDVEADNTDALDHAHNEIMILRMLGRHPRIVELVDVAQDGEDSTGVRIVQELCDGGNLFDRVVERGRYEEHEACLVVEQLLQGVGFMHSRGIMHRDIKPENILLVSPDSDIDIKLCDFGISKMADLQQGRMPRSNSFTGSAHYVAPEMIKQEEYGVEIDIWALGVVSYALIAGRLPFGGKKDAELLDIYREVVRGDLKFEGEAWEETSREAIRFVQKLLSLAPEARPSAMAALALPWMQTAPEWRRAQEEEEAAHSADDDYEAYARPSSDSWMSRIPVLIS
eukprot:TRINITY_DN10564_c0_g1_i1.p1 TRINITY_DN10564_c0_g1~~TRINITY_DN10564_c0_g1_i1.p1  ORF type:complete len:343 (-),score=84.99 TRINITY_DN10564_c0_g1_i1:534-1562(-)